MTARRRHPSTRIAWRWLLAAALAASSAQAQPAPTPPAAGAPRLTRPPRLTHFVEAPYPDAERAGGRQATVVLQLVLGADGKVEEATVAQSAGPSFDAAALTAARAFLFEPALVDDQPARIKILYRYEFVLRPEAPTTARFRGVVRTRAGKRPLAGITVAVEACATQVTDAAGAFALDDVPPGRHRVTLSGPRLLPTQIAETFVAGQQLAATYDVTLAAPATTERSDDLEIVVTAPPLRRQAVSSEVSAAEARKLPGTQGDVLRVVENMPGVARAAAGSGQLIVWGAAPEDTRVYIDGVPVPRLYHDGGLRSVLPSELVSAVELAPGGYGPAYSRGLGGLLTVTTRALDETGVHGAVGLDLYDASAALRAQLSKRVHLALGLRRSHLDSLLGAVDSHAGEYFPIPHYWDAQARLAVQLAPRELLDVTGLFSFDQLSRGRDSVDPLLYARETRGVWFYRVSARYQNQLPGGRVVSVTPYVGYDHDQLRQQVGSTVAGVTTGTLVAGLRASWRGRLAAWLTAEAGFDGDLRDSQVTRDGSTALPAREGDVRVFGQPPPGALASDAWETLRLSLAPYAEGDVALFGGRLHVTPGLRVDPYVRAASRQTPTAADTPGVGLFAHDFRAEPRLTVTGAPARFVHLKAAVGLYHQQPLPEDLSAIFGNPSLPVAEVAQYLLSAAFKLPARLTIEATGFYSRSTGLAVRSPFPSPVLAQALVPTGEGRAYGAQILIREELFHGLFGWISYTWSRSERRDDDHSPWRLSDYDQTHAFTAVAAYQLPRGFEVGLRARVASGYPRTPVESASYDASTDLYQPVFGAQNSIRIPLFFQLDARVAKRFRFGSSELEIYLDVQNATDRGNPEEIVYNHDYSRRGYITGLPVLPVLGAQWKF